MKFSLLPVLAAAAIAAGALVSCKPLGSLTARPDPNTATAGTLGSVKATNGVLPIGQRRAPLSLDTLVAKH